MFKTNSPAFLKLNSLLEAYNFDQLVTEPTRVTLSSLTLIDVIISSNNSNIKKDINVINLSQMSDHDLVCCKLNVTRNIDPPVIKTIRDFKYFDYSQFRDDLQSIRFESIYDMNNVNDKVHFLNEAILTLFNMHAPLKTIKITKKHSPWITDNIRLLMSLRDKARTKFRQNKTDALYNYYKALRNYTTLACRNEKRAYFEYELRMKGANNIWKNLNLLNIRKPEKCIPDHLKNPEDLNNYYVKCIPAVHPDQSIINFYKNNVKSNVQTFNFKQVSEFSVQKILYNIKTNAQGHDGFNIKLILMCCPTILPFLTHIINVCLKESVFPDSWKEALVKPVPKINNPEEFKDLRPISILPVLSKVLEREVDMQLRDHISKFNILPEVQSGFRPLHSCETALLNITDDILRGVDNKKVTVLVLIDFSKAFDTLNHEILLSLLKFVGMSENVVKFFCSYLYNRTQRTKIDHAVSTPLKMSSGVPQGSILGPLLYTLYTSDFLKVVKYCQMHFYADDTQLYLSFNPSDSAEAMNNINTDVASIVNISKRHSLNINATKTSVLVFGPQSIRPSISQQVRIIVDGQPILPVEHAKNLGVTFDTCLRFRIHINNCIRSAYMNLKLIYNNRFFLNQKTKTILCESLVLSKFNFSDAVYGPCIFAEDSRRIQVIQNSCLRLIFGIRRRQHISYKLNETGWLNMSRRRLLHSACLFKKIIDNKIPAYLYNKITYRTDVHNLNLRHKGTLSSPRRHTEAFKSSFTYQIAKIYSLLPLSMQNKCTTSFKYSYKKMLLAEQSCSLTEGN